MVYERKVMKILNVKFYQGVKLGGDTVTFVENNIPKVGTGKPGVKGCTIEQTEHGVLIKKDKLATLSSWNNVQYIEYDTTEQEVKKSSVKNGNKQE